MSEAGREKDGTARLDDASGSHPRTLHDRPVMMYLMSALAPQIADSA